MKVDCICCVGFVCMLVCLFGYCLRVTWVFGFGNGLLS